MENGAFSIYFENSLLLIMITLISSLILVSPIKMIALKFKSMQVKDNYPKIALLAGGILILLLLKIPGIPLVVLYYILISVAFQRQLK
jgi:CDP-diacylglycerol--serine O-phosphatidyltransferase